MPRGPPKRPLSGGVPFDLSVYWQNWCWRHTLAALALDVVREGFPGR